MATKEGEGKGRAAQCLEARKVIGWKTRPPGQDSSVIIFPLIRHFTETGSRVDLYAWIVCKPRSPEEAVRSLMGGIHPSLEPGAHSHEILHGDRAFHLFPPGFCF